MRKMKKNSIWFKKASTFFLTLGLSVASFAQAPSMIIGGIEVRGMKADKEILRTVIYKSIVGSKKYLVADRYDVSEKIGKDVLDNCLGKECLMNIGAQMNSDYALSASYDVLGDRILISMKMIDVKNKSIFKNEIGEFENQVNELNRMTDIMIYRMLEVPLNANVEKALSYKDNPAASSGPGKMNNSGPRIGLGYVFGENADYLTRSEADGGKGAVPLIFNLGYQLEAQYVGSENFSGLFEFIFNVGGLEQGMFIPSLAVLNGARFGKNSWEIAIGPSLSMKQLVKGANYNGKFTTERELYAMSLNPADFELFTRPDTRGATYFSSNFVVGIGRTFKSGAISIPVNGFASFNKYGTSVGLSMGMNVIKSKQPIQRRKIVY
jgi:hypothetical protein